MCMDCVRLHAVLQEQSEEMFWLRKRITSLESDVRKERSVKRKLIKEKKKQTKPKRKYKEDKFIYNEADFFFDEQQALNQ